MYTSPQFGGSATDDDLARYEKTGHFKDEIFHNPTPTSRGFSWDVFTKTLREYYKDNPNREPQGILPLVKQDSLTLVNTQTEAKIIWFGHSAFLLQLDGKNILFDPMLTDAPSPVAWVSKKRYSKELPIAIEKLPSIDFVFISHDHYDHLDYESIKRLKQKTKKFIVPIGVGAHFKAWHVQEDKIHEYNWWDEATVNGLNFVFTPTRHFSGRGITDHNSTLWGSWVILGETAKIYFSGDGGYDTHFKKIGDKYGPFDLALLECGQYNYNWKQIHMLPEETAQAAKDVKAKVAMPIHWGAFTLSLHPWYEPPTRMKAAADSLNIKVITPIIGKTIALDTITEKFNPWWLSIEK